MSAILSKLSSKVGRSESVTWWLWVQRCFTLNFHWILSVSFSLSERTWLFLYFLLAWSRLQMSSVHELSGSFTAIFQRQHDPLLHFDKAKFLPWHFIFKRDISWLCAPNFSLSSLLSVYKDDASSCSHFLPQRGSSKERWTWGQTGVCIQPPVWPRSVNLCPSQSINFLSWKMGPSMAGTKLDGGLGGRRHSYVAFSPPRPPQGLREVKYRQSEFLCCWRTCHVGRRRADFLIASLSMTPAEISVHSLSYAYRIFGLQLTPLGA